jgi:NAD(P)-dependent dehydrogenase (short-subunit alcohol dehydrogenase family)
MSEFLNKIVVVTGGYQGNGLAIVDIFLEAGAIVYSLDNKFSKKKESIGKLTRIKIDISNLKLIKKIIYQIGKNENKIDILVNNAGVSLKYSKKNVINYWNKTISVNLTAAYFFSLFCLPFLKRNNDSNIINITSLNGKIAMSGNPAYNASKGGLSALTACLAMDYAKYEIRVNAVSPGYIKTNMTNKSFNNKSSFKKRTERMMIKKYGSPNDIAEAVKFLASQKSKYINATEIIVDGGLLKKGI